VPSADLPMAIMFILFLMLFVAIGIYPAWKRTAVRLRNFLRTREQLLRPGVGPLAEPEEEPEPSTFELRRQALQLNDFEIFVLRRLAQAGAGGLSSRQLQAELHFDPPLVRKTLDSLLERGLVQEALPTLLGRRFHLSARGRDFAAGQGYLPEIRDTGARA